MSAALAAAVLMALVAITAVAFSASALRSERRQNARERDLLVNQILHLSGRTWQAPPSEAEQSPSGWPTLPSWTAHPEAIDWGATPEEAHHE